MDATITKWMGFRFSRHSRSSVAGIKYFREKLIEWVLFAAASVSINITLGIVGVLTYESSRFFQQVSLVDFLTDTQWTPLFSQPHYGILPLVSGTFVTTAVALVVAIPVGTITAIYLKRVRFLWFKRHHQTLPRTPHCRADSHLWLFRLIIRHALA